MTKELDFSEPNERRYREFTGNSLEAMPLLIAEGRVPLSVKDIMERRLRSENPVWMENYFDTGDAVACHPDGEIKIILDSEILTRINPKSRIIRTYSNDDFTNGALIISEDAYKKLKGPLIRTFKVEDLERNLSKYGRSFSSEEIKENPVWMFLARNDRELLRAYVDEVYETGVEPGSNMDVDIREYGYSFNEKEERKLNKNFTKPPILMSFNIGGKRGHYGHYLHVSGFAHDSRFVGRLGKRKQGKIK